MKIAFRTTTPWWEKLRIWHECEIELPACGHIECLLENLSQQLATDQPTDKWAIHCRERFLRSPRVDDVVIVGETAWALKPTGWLPVSLQADDVVVVDGQTRMRERQSKVNKWGGDVRAFTRADVAKSAAELRNSITPVIRFVAQLPPHPHASS